MRIETGEHAAQCQVADQKESQKAKLEARLKDIWNFF
jgi:hypothetical protein